MSEEFRDLESWSTEDWDDSWDELDAQAEEIEAIEQEDNGGNWARSNPDRVPPAYQEIAIPGLLEHHSRVISLYLGKVLGAMLRDRARYVRTRDMIWARELVQDVAEICTMCWSAARSEDKPDDDAVAVRWMGWAVDNGLVSSQQLADAYWLADLHGVSGTNTPEDAMRLGISRAVGALHNRPAPIGSEPVIYTHGDPDPTTGIKEVEVVDDTFEISSSVVQTQGRISSIRVSDRMPKGDSRRDLFWFKFIEGKSQNFWVGEANTERALYKLVQGLEPKVTGKFTLKAKKVDIRVSANLKAPALLTVPAESLLWALVSLTDQWGNLRDQALMDRYNLAFRIHGAKEVPSWVKELPAELDGQLAKLINCLRGKVEDIHLAVWGRIVDDWRALLGIRPPPPGPANQLPALTLTCMKCHKAAGSVYADGLCHSCHRSENPL